MAGDDRKRSRSPSDEEAGNVTSKRHQSAQGVVNPSNEAEQKKLNPPPANGNGSGNGEDITMADGSKGGAAQNESAATAQIHMRCLIVTQDASIIIGKGGSHVNEIREKSGAKVMVSESIPGNPERILNVSGALDAVSKVCTTPWGVISLN